MELYINSPLRSARVPDIRLVRFNLHNLFQYFKDQKFSSRARSHEDIECLKRLPPVEFAKLPPYVKNGKLKMEATITVDWKNVKGISAMADFQRFIKEDNEEEKEKLLQTINELEKELVRLI